MKSYQLYKEIEVSSEVVAASQHRQIQLLMEKCLQHMQTAKNAMINKEYANKHLATSKANEIINYLRMCLNFKDVHSESLSKQLDELYAYTSQSLVTANLKNDPRFIDQAIRCLSLIKEGWDGIA